MNKKDIVIEKFFALIKDFIELDEEMTFTFRKENISKNGLLAYGIEFKNKNGIVTQSLHTDTFFNPERFNATYNENVPSMDIIRELSK